MDVQRIEISYVTHTSRKIRTRIVDVPEEAVAQNRGRVVSWVPRPYTEAECVGSAANEIAQVLFPETIRWKVVNHRTIKA